MKYFCNNRISKRRSALALTMLASSIMLAGCNSDSGSSFSGNNGSTSKNVSINGVAAKGILIGAEIKACYADEPTVCFTTTTDEKGAYSITAPTDRARTLIVTATHKAGAQMVCDIPAGCGKDVIFGDKVNMPEDLSLRTLAPVSATSNKVESHISPITELVTAAAIVSSTDAKYLSADAISKGSDAVRNMLGLPMGGDLTAIEPIDVTDEDALKNINADTLSLNMVSVALAGSNFTTMSDNLEKFTKAIADASVSTGLLGELNTASQDLLKKSPVPNENKVAVEEAIKSANANATKDCDKTCSVAVSPSDVPADASKDPNVANIRSLVGDIRTVGTDIYKDMNQALAEGEDGFAQNTVMYEIDEASAIFDKNLEQVIYSFSEIAGLLSLRIEAEYMLGSEYMKDVGLKLSDLAKAQFKEWHEWEVEAKNQCIDFQNLNDNVEFCNYFTYGTQEELEEGAEEYAKLFGDALISRNDNVWTIKNAQYGVGEDKVTVNIEVNFSGIPENGATDTLLLELTATASNSAVTFNINQGKFALDFSENVQLEKDEYCNGDENEDGCVGEKGFVWELESLPFITRGELLANASITAVAEGVTRTFNGEMQLIVETPQAQRDKNKNNWAAVLPEFVKLSGGFESSKGVSVSAAISAELDNSQFTYIAENTETDVPYTITLSDDRKIIDVQLGDEANNITFQLLAIEQRYLNTHCPDYENGYSGCYDYFVYYNDLRVFGCEGNGEGYCPSWFEDKIPVECVDEECGSYLDYEPVFDALGRNDNYIEYIFDQPWLQTENGKVRFPNVFELHQEDFAESNVIKGFATVYENDFSESETNFMKGKITAELKGKLATTLPEMDIKFVVDRTAYKAANASLELGWTEPERKRKYLKISTEASDLNNIDASKLTYTISNANGAEFTLNLTEKEVKEGVQVGSVMKDKTEYATVTKENGIYFITYEYNDKGETQKIKAFESLF